MKPIIPSFTLSERSQYAHPANAEAISHCRAAIKALYDRAVERKSRGVLGVNAV